MRPSKLLLGLLLVWVFLGLTVVVAEVLSWNSALVLRIIFWCYLALLAVLVLVDGFRLRHKPPMRATRTLDPHLALGVRQRVIIKLDNLSAEVQTLCLTDSPPSQIQLDGLPVNLTVKPDSHALVRYWITPLRRGPAEFGRVCCRLRSRWGYWERNFYYGEFQQSRVYPNYKPLFRSSFINSDQLYADLGVQVRQRRGDGTDFNQLRDFRVGDSLRQVDWRATARFQKPISREYQEERDQQVVFLLDCGRRMRAKDGEISHFDHALNALLLSAFVALRQGDSVGLLSFAGQCRWVPPIKGRFQVSHLLEQIYDLHSSLETSDYLEVAQQLISRQPRRSLVILISSLQPQDRDDLSKAAKLMSRHHLVMVASMRQQVLSDTQSAEIVSLDDALSYCGVAGHLQAQAAMFSELRSDNVIVADTPPASMHSTLINEYLALKRGGIF